MKKGIWKEFRFLAKGMRSVFGRVTRREDCSLQLTEECVYMLDAATSEVEQAAALPTLLNQLHYRVNSEV